ncbi:MAG: histidine kinase [Acidimicrobiales bacterium]
MSSRPVVSLRVAGWALLLLGVLATFVLGVTTEWPDDLLVPALLSALPGLTLVVASYFDVTGEAGSRLASTAVTLTAAVAAAVLSCVVLVVGFGGGPDGEDETNLFMLGVVGAVVAAWSVFFVRAGLFSLLARLSGRTATTGRELVARLDSAIVRELPIEELLAQTAEGIRQSQQAAVVEIWTGPPEQLTLTMSLPPRAAPPVALSDTASSLVARSRASGRDWVEVWLPEMASGWDVTADTCVAVVPLTTSGVLCGVLAVVRHTPFGDDEHVLLEQLATRLAPVVENAQLGEQLSESLRNLRRHAKDLQASRSRLVTAGDEVRRRIERDLHDGVQQQLVALTLSLGLCERMLAEGRNEDLAQLLEELKSESTELASALRDLAHGIYPPLLRDAGLVKALKALVDRQENAAVEGACGRLPADVEATVYFCCAEALQNVQKHAPGSPVLVSVAEERDRIRFGVCDEGPGFDTSSGSSGLGLTNMRDRIGGLGGALDVTSGAGGTKLTGFVPLAGSSVRLRAEENKNR